MPARKPIDAPFKFEVHSDTGCQILLSRLAALDNGFVVEISPVKRYDTKKQKGLYRAWIADISDHTGDDWSSIDKYIRRELLPIWHEVICGKKIARLTSVDDLEKHEMSVFLDRLSAYNGQHIGANLRDPNEYRKRRE